MRRTLYGSVASLLVLSADVSSAGELLPYESSGWRYRQVPWGDPLIGTFYSASFDDSGWNVGQAAFGNFGELNAPPPFCLAAYSIHSQWDVNTDVLLRRYFNASAASPVTIYLSIDNDAEIYVNGIHVYAVTHAGCPLVDDFSFTVPYEALDMNGSNLLAIHAHDSGWFSFVDVRIEGEFPPVSVRRLTWGSVKARYR